MNPGQRARISEVVRYFLHLGLLGFGGPVALVGQMERELVTSRGWLTKEQMREAIAICQSLPGPLAIQVGIYLSYLRAGNWAAWAGGWAFILPNFIIVAALAAVYVRAGGLQWVSAVFYGVSPAVIALILHSCFRLARLGLEDGLQWVIAALCLLVTVVLQTEVALLFVAAGIVGILYYGVLRGRPRTSATLSAISPLASHATASTLSKLGLFFLKAGALTFGSGLVIVPFLQQGVVRQYGWLSERDFLVAVAIGMISPGPVVITATFVGYLVAGFWGALIATIGIFLPSFILVQLAAPVLAAHRANRYIQGFVKGTYGAAIGTILGACVLLGKTAVGDWLTVLIAVASLVALFRWKLSNPMLMLLTAIIGIVAFPLLHPTWLMLK
ncbi:MAG TPA: chromate efflux transporter [Steroidobacteraceae bacterium]|nr:chromate efflux transporter [Steroidobacteraceae bacterium]